jgi:hypothetical protein
LSIAVSGIVVVACSCKWLCWSEVFWRLGGPSPRAIYACHEAVYTREPSTSVRRFEVGTNSCSLEISRRTRRERASESESFSDPSPQAY